MADSRMSNNIIVEKREREEFKRGVRDVLNKLTSQNLQSSVEQIIKLPIDTLEKANDVVMLIFEKVIEKPDLSALYASLCPRLAKEVVFKATISKIGLPKHITVFRNALLDKIEHEFNINVVNFEESRNIRLNPIVESLKTCQDPVKSLEILTNLEEEKRKIRNLSGGIVFLTGELYLVSMLTNNIIRHCITDLLDPTSEDKLEYLCKLLTIVGKKYESTPADGYRSERLTLDSVIQKMQSIVDEEEGSNISNRIRFMLKAVIELRNQW